MITELEIDSGLPGAPAVVSSDLLRPVAVLFARSDSIYKTLPACDVWDMERDARNFRGKMPVVAHPPCRAWSRMRWAAKPRHDEKDLARFALKVVRENGGVIEHPASSLLWREENLPAAGEKDKYGGWTYPVLQMWWGHRAYKATWLYIVGCDGRNLPPTPLKLGDAEAWCGQWGKAMRAKRTNTIPKPALSPKEREATPIEFAKWLVELARRTKGRNDQAMRPETAKCQ